VKCGRLSCGLVREERQILSSATNAVLSSSYRWRRDCVRNAKTLVMNSGIEEEDLVIITNIDCTKIVIIIITSIQMVMKMED